MPKLQPKFDQAVCPHAHVAEFTTFRKCSDCGHIMVTDKSAFYEERGPGAFNDAKLVVEAKDRAVKSAQASRAQVGLNEQKRRDEAAALQAKEDKALYVRMQAEHRDRAEILEEWKRLGWTQQRMADALDLSKVRITQLLDADFETRRIAAREARKVERDRAKVADMEARARARVESKAARMKIRTDKAAAKLEARAKLKAERAAERARLKAEQVEYHKRLTATSKRGRNAVSIPPINFAPGARDEILAPLRATDRGREAITAVGEDVAAVMRMMLTAGVPAHKIPQVREAVENLGKPVKKLRSVDEVSVEEMIKAVPPKGVWAAMNEVFDDWKLLDKTDLPLRSACMVVICAQIVGVDARRIAKYAGLTRGFVLRLFRAWRRQEILNHENKFLCEHIGPAPKSKKEDRNQTMELMLIGMAGLRIIERRGANKADIGYQLPEYRKREEAK